LKCVPWRKTAEMDTAHS